MLRKRRKPGRRSTTVEDLATEASKHYNTPETDQKNCVGFHVDICDAKFTVDLRGQRTFCKRCDVNESVRKRQGKRVKYQRGKIVQSLDNEYPVHDVRPHAVCYIDHTPAVIATVGPDGVALGKPTLTIGVDGNTKQARAMVLTYGAPSAWTVLLLLRDYVRRNGRLPKIISVDNGKEFYSGALKFFCKLYKIDLRYRSPGEPRGLPELLIGSHGRRSVALRWEITGRCASQAVVPKSINPFGRGVTTPCSPRRQRIFA